jgi:Yip1-like protein
VLAFIAGALYAATFYWLGGGLLYRAARRLGSEGTWLRSRHVLGLAAAPLALSLLTLWPIRIAVYGTDLFRSGGNDYGRGDAVFGTIYYAFIAWSVWLLFVGVRSVHGWTWARATATVLLAAVVPVLIVLASTV